VVFGRENYQADQKEQNALKHGQKKPSDAQSNENPSDDDDGNALPGSGHLWLG
jgi:hypothetical protein